MLINRLLPDIRELLVTMPQDAPLVEVAKVFRKGIDLVVICDPAGRISGVITKTDVVGRISDRGTAHAEPAHKIMTREVVSCRSTDWGTAVWELMKQHRLKNIPVVDEDRRPVGVVTARLVLQLLLSETTNEEVLLRDYVMNVGYH